MERLALLHMRLQTTILLLLLILVAWGLVEFFRRRPVEGLYRAGISIGALLIGAQALLGLMLLFSIGSPARLALHIVYGVVAAAGLPALLFYTRERTSHWDSLICAAVCLFLSAIVVRAFETVG